MLDGIKEWVSSLPQVNKLYRPTFHHQILIAVSKLKLRLISFTRALFLYMCCERYDQQHDHNSASGCKAQGMVICHSSHCPLFKFLLSLVVLVHRRPLHHHIIHQFLFPGVVIKWLGICACIEQWAFWKKPAYRDSGNHNATATYWTFDVLGSDEGMEKKYGWIYWRKKKKRVLVTHTCCSTGQDDWIEEYKFSSSYHYGSRVTRNTKAVGQTIVHTRISLHHLQSYHHYFCQDII